MDLELGETGITGMHEHIQCFPRCWDPNSTPHAYTANPSQTEHLPSPKLRVRCIVYKYVSVVTSPLDNAEALQFGKPTLA